MIMVLIGRLDDISELFVSASKLQSAATGLRKLVDEQINSKDETENIKWAEEIVREMDWNSKDYKPNPDLCVIATRLRPLFYKELLKLKIPVIPKFSEAREEFYKIFEFMAEDIQTALQCSYRIGQV